MRLSEDRIASISRKIADRLVAAKALDTKATPGLLAAWIERPIMEYLQREDAIDDEVRRQIANLSKPPPEGSFDYEALFRKKKEEIARRRGYDK